MGTSASDMDDIFSLDGPTPVLGQYAIHNDKTAVHATTDARLDLALDPATANNPLALTQGQARKVTQNRIRSAMAELAHGNIGKVNEWLDRVGAQDPARAIELFLQLSEFTLPKLKAVAIDVKDTSGGLKTLSVRELEQLVAGDDSVVAQQ